MTLDKQSILLLFISASVLIIVQPQERTDAQWSYFVFTQQWPQAACIDANATGHKCIIPSNVTTWTVHGLWPSDPHTHEGPANCNSSWKFQERLILSLENDMKKYWPNLFVGEPKLDFWAHEWDKHGTCSTDLPATSTEYDYFSQTLLLNEYFNLTQIFLDGNITPGKSYMLADIEKVLKAKLNHLPHIQCVMNETFGEGETQFIYQIEMCLDKTFNVIECPHSNQLLFEPKHKPHGRIETGMCGSKRPVQYLEILH